jgi:group I intron endonuclease
MIELENRAGIYCYINLVNWKKYVGQSVTVQKRILHHHEGYLKKKDVCHQGESPLLWKAVRKYGRDNFEVFVIEYCDVDDLDDKEIFWIERLKSNAREWGYNLTTGGESNFRGVSPSPETLQKRVDAITRTELAGRKLTRSELPDRIF